MPPCEKYVILFAQLAPTLFLGTGNDEVLQQTTPNKWNAYRAQRNKSISLIGKILSFFSVFIKNKKCYNSKYQHFCGEIIFSFQTRYSV